MSASWVDPDDIVPGASKTARRVTGWRAFCPLRRMAANAASGITEHHIAAADTLRAAADVARLGYMAARDDMPARKQPGPVAGPSAAKLAQASAKRTYDRAMRQFTIEQQDMVVWVILANSTLYSFVRMLAEDTGRRIDPAVEKGKLLAILDVLAVHFRQDIGL